MGKTVTRTCRVCSKEFQADAWRESHEKYRRKVCGLVCAKKWHPPVEIRFFNKVEKRENGCWIWVGHCNSRGYPMFYEDGEVLAGHRWAYEHWIGPIPEGKILRHKCDESRCANPLHLEPGSLQDNSRDCVTRGRSKLAKLSVEKVKEIRRLIGEGKVDWSVYRKVAKDFGVLPSCIYHVHIRKTWRWVA